MKKNVINLLIRILGWQVRRLRKKNAFIIVAVAGSVGKTSTKFAIASLLEGSRRVRWQQGNYNTILTVPLVFFGQPIPRLYNPFAWLKVLFENEIQLHKKYAYDVVVLELGTDGPGQLKEFAAYLQNDIAVITAVSPEHMEFFTDLDAVAREELSVSEFSNTIILNSDLIDYKYYKSLQKITNFGIHNAQVTIHSSSKNIDLKKDGKKWLEFANQIPSRNQLYSLTAAVIVAEKLNLEKGQIIHAIPKIITPPGRMQFLKGLKDSLIIDETYNASPDAVIAALDYLYQQKATQRIALLGNMNELGAFSQSEHERIGKYCDSNKLDYVLTLGPDANKFLAPAAQKAGCVVKTFDTPYELGAYVKGILKHGSLVLAKGSQNNVYMEEAIKALLATKKDEIKLVRQTTEWLAKKRKNFSE